MRLLQIDNLFYCKRIISENGKIRPTYVESFNSNTSPAKLNRSMADQNTPMQSTYAKNYNQDYGGVSEIESPIKNIDFDRETSQIKQTGRDGKETIIQISIDLFSLKVFAILLCRGSTREKAELFFDLIVGY